ncbi:MAG: tripartite tricarboxylate transporter substrate binding protein [Ferrovibrio sp.]|uniref:Bug family tripartite tricarboxylate transporter substrate binding protein n=1 Tax=Ferrovibrio sp. TaxID=1917215 RepID=UPI0026047363|nr:tripartite tricarboxylate transporter substrate binding protein [Ferrovibrio sp.]MCW0234874.1 tripartite tricarboxylate transporter substrate binding protein [Ferrovibrio sp.]
MQGKLAIRTAVAAFVAGTLGFVAQPAAAQQWKPTKPITIIVPWAAGGSTDQVTRVTAAELEKELGQKVVVVNQPGASGSIGTKSVLEGSKDGYTWAAGAAKDVGSYAVSGLLNTTANDWDFYLTVANQAVISVNPNTPYKSVADLLAAMKAKPGQVSFATAGVNSSGHYGSEALSRAAGATYKHVSYDGGNPAVIATVSGETEVTSQLGVEQIEMIRGKRLRPLAVLASKPLEVDGVAPIEPITKTLPGFRTEANYFGIFVPKGVPAEVIATLDKIWAEKIKNNAALKKYSAEKGALFGPEYGEAAKKASFPAIQGAAWILQEGGKAKVSPDTLGIPKP